MSSHSLFRSTLLYLPVQIATPFVQFVVLVTWTHLLDPAAFGVATFIVAVQELCGLIGLMWWSMYILRFQRRFAQMDNERFLAMDRRMVIAASLIQIALAPVCLVAISAEVTSEMIAASAAYYIARMVFMHFSEWARSNHRIALYSVAQLAGPILGSILSVVAVEFFGPHPAVAVAAMALGQGVGAIILIVSQNLGFGLGKFDRSIFDDARRYGLPLIFSGMFAWTAINGVRLIVQEFDGLVGVGLFSAGWGIGQRIANVIAMLCTAAAYPIAVDKIESGDKSGALKQTALNGALMFSLLMPVMTGACVLAEPIVNLMIAEQYRATTVLILPIAVIVGSLRALKTHTADQACLLLDKTKENFASSVVDSVFAVIGAGGGLMLGGIAGAAIGSLAGMVIAASISVGYARLRLHLPFDALTHLKIVASSLVMAAAVRMLPLPNSYPALGAEIVLGAVVYLANVLAMFPYVRREIFARLRSRAYGSAQ